MKKPIIIGLYGGPGTGKSTLATRVFTEMKELGLSVEYTGEFAKDLTWDESFGVLSDQIYVFAEQNHRVFRLAKKVDYIITDSPILFSIIYGEMYGGITENFRNLVLEEFNRYPRFDVFVERVHKYDPIGRNEDSEKAIFIDNRINDTFTKYDYRWDLKVPSSKGSSKKIIEGALAFRVSISSTQLPF